MSRDSFAEAFTAGSRVLWCIAAGVLGSSDLVEDVLQESAMIALQKLHQFDPETNFTAWTGRIVHYTALNHARRRKRTGGTAIEIESVECPQRKQESPVDRAGGLCEDQLSFDDDILAALKELDETARACLLLKTILEMPYREISAILEIPEGTAMSHVHRARQALRKRLCDRAPSNSECESVA